MQRLLAAWRRLLLDKGGAIPDAEDKYGRRPLYHAAVSRDSDVVRLLLENGADIKAKDYKGESAYGTAIRSWHTAVAQLLLKVDTDRDAENKEELKAEASITAPGM